MALPVSGRTALITGAGSGIGLAFAQLLLSQNCNVVVADLALTPAADEAFRPHQSAAGEPKKEPGVLFVHCDVTDWAQLRGAFEKAVEAFGRVDVVCPGAGVFEPPWSNFWQPNNPKSTDTDAQSTYKTLDLNLSHPLRATQLAIDHFLAQPAPPASKDGTPTSRGVVLLISSIAAQSPFFPVPLYVASKSAISGFTRALATMEPAYNIRVAAVAPGIVRTPIWSEMQQGWIDETAGDKWITPKEIAEAMLDIVQKAEYVGGSVVEVGLGGRRMVEGLNDPGPSGEGRTVGKAAEAFGDTVGVIAENFGKGGK